MRIRKFRPVRAYWHERAEALRAARAETHRAAARKAAEYGVRKCIYVTRWWYVLPRRAWRWLKDHAPVRIHGNGDVAFGYGRRPPVWRRIR